MVNPPRLIRFRSAGAMACRSICELTDREKKHLLQEILHARGLMPLLMKPRNSRLWTREDKAELAIHLRRLSSISPYLIVLALPGSFLMLPALACIFRESDRGGFMCLLIAGAAEIFKQDNKSGSKRIGRTGPGLTVGEMALVDGEQRSATCICPEPSTLVMLIREQFVRIIREHPAWSVNILLKIVTMMSRRLRQTSGQLVDYLQD
jgi:hypothetical protein